METQILSGTPEILFAGGCHVSGFPVGLEHSFSHVALHCLSLQDAVSPVVLDYVILRSGPRVLAECRERKVELLVLQLGHYETMLSFRKIFHRNRSNGSTVAEHIRYAPEPDKIYRPTLQSIMMSSCRFALAGILAGLGQNKGLMSEATMSASLDSILTSLEPLALGKVLVISPFSCPDPLTRARRRVVARIFEREAEKHGCVFIDAFGMLESFGRGKAFLSNFADQYHLSRLGHERVGLLVGKHLKCAVEEIESLSAVYQL